MALLFDRMLLAKETLVENIPSAKQTISWSLAHPYVILMNFSPNIPLVREIFQK